MPQNKKKDNQPWQGKSEIPVGIEILIGFAKIAQLVEHNLAKVGVAGSSPVFRSKDAAVVESVDTQDLKSCNHCDCAGSSPACGTHI